MHLIRCLDAVPSRLARRAGEQDDNKLPTEATALGGRKAPARGVGPASELGDGVGRCVPARVRGGAHGRPVLRLFLDAHVRLPQRLVREGVLWYYSLPKNAILAQRHALVS